jgi:hypothetical protein
VSGLQELAADVGAVLAAFPAAGQVHRIEYLAAAGGMSGAKLWRLQTDVGTLCLRRWPEEHPTAEYLAWLARVLEHVRRAGCDLLPRTIFARDGRPAVSLGGRLWSLEQWLTGAADDSRPMSQARVQAAMAALAQFHQAAAGFVEAEPQADWFHAPASAAHGPSPGIVRRRQQLAQLRQQAAAELQRAFAMSVPAPWKAAAEAWLATLHPAASIVTAQLEEAAQIEAPLQPCLRDVWKAHVLFEGDRVTGLVDLAAMRLDHPATDIARLLASIAHDDLATWQTGLAAYEAVRPLTAADRQLVAAFDASAMLMTPWSWFRWVLLEERQFEQPHEQILQRVWETIDRASALVARAGRAVWEG